jgi:hypothetical protein
MGPTIPDQLCGQTLKSSSVNFFFTYWSNIDVAHGSRVDGDAGYAEQVASTDSLQIGRVKESLAQLVLLNGEVDVVAIGELIGGGRDTATVINPGMEIRGNKGTSNPFQNGVWN